MAEGVKMTNWMKTIIFLLLMAELGRVSVCVCAPVYYSPGSRSTHVSRPASPLRPPILGFRACAFSRGL